MSTAHLQHLLRRAAATIADDADRLRLSCHVSATHTDWGCPDCAHDCSPRRRYERDMALVRELRTEADSIKAAS